MFKGNIQNFLQSWGRLCAVTLFFVTFAAFLFWLDFFRVYEAEVDILVIGKTPVVSTEQVVENFVGLSRSLSFYDRVLAGDDQIDDDFQGYSKDDRKKLWRKTLSVKRIGESGILTLRAKNVSAETAKLLVEQSAKELFSVAGFYYNVKTDIDMRVVDGPIIRTRVDNVILYSAVSIATGILFTSLFFLFLQITPFFFQKTQKNRIDSRSLPESSNGGKAYPHFNIGDSVPLIDPKKFVPSRPTSLSYENYSQEEKQEEKRIREEILSSSVKSSAPDNLPTASTKGDLPVATEELPFTFEDVKEENTTETFEESLQQAMPENEKKTSEPTVEEYKRRLNELLKGNKQ